MMKRDIDMKNTKAFQRGLEDALRIADQMVRHPDDFQGDAIVIPLSSLAAGRTGLTPARWGVLRAVRNQGPFRTLEALATALKRPVPRVSQDVRALERLHLIVTTRHGKTKQLRAEIRPILVW